MVNYNILLAILGFSILMMAWLPNLLVGKPLTHTILFIIFGIFIYSLPLNIPEVDYIENGDFIVRLTELSVIVSLMGTGLKLDTPMSWRNWKGPFLLILIAMIFSIASLVIVGKFILGFSLAGAVLLGAVLAPTDPVLAGDVQVGPPNEGGEDNVRFSLTAEAGLNDGMAFPFTWLAIMMANNAENLWSNWFLEKLLYKVFAGILLGALFGRILAYLLFSLPNKIRFPKTTDGFVAFAATLFIYGVTELLHGYGFLAVFFTGLMVSRYEKEHVHNKEMHDFMDQVERITMVLLVIPLGGILAKELFDEVTWLDLLVVFLFLFILRPLGGILSLIPVKIPWKEKLAISFFGIRGIGSFYYLAFAYENATFKEHSDLWRIVSLIVLCSIFIHGFTATPIMNYFDKFRNKFKAKVES